MKGRDSSHLREVIRAGGPPLKRAEFRTRAGVPLLRSAAPP